MTQNKYAGGWGRFGSVFALAGLLAAFLLPESAHATRGKRFMFRLSPVQLAAGLASPDLNGGKLSFYGAEAEVAITNGLAIGPILYSYSYDNAVDQYELSGISYGARATWYMNQSAIGSSWILSPFFNFIPVSGTATRTDSGTGLVGEISSSATILQAGFTFGYQFVTEMGLSFSIGAGLQKYFTPDEILMVGTVSGPGGTSADLPEQRADLSSISAIPVLPAFELTVGWAF